MMKAFFAGVVSILLLVPAAAAQDASPKKLAPQTQNGVKLVSGGVGNREQAALDRMEDDYSVRITMSNSEGAYLSGVHLSIETDSGKRLVELEARGPIVLADLEPGRYVLHARAEGRMTEHRVFDVPKEDQARIFVTLNKQGPE